MQYITHILCILFCPMSYVISRSLLGGLDVKKKKIHRQFVKRILMGPDTMFTPELLEDEFTANKLEVWGLVWHERSPVDLSSFQESLQVGKMKADSPPDLSEGGMWLSSGFLEFPSNEASICRDMFGKTPKPLIHTSFYLIYKDIYIYVS